LNKKDAEDVPELWMRGIISWSKAINCWVVGPGLGRDTYIGDFFPKLITNLPSEQTVVFNADGIYHICRNPELF
jgi:NAD(P)H-hydrate repair Nnr-like enzyme with NAD(P)H-hydrate dehydratase domain